MHEEGLVAAIAADLDAEEPRLIYADWLQSIGDPLGELIVLACRGVTEEVHTRYVELESRVRAEIGFETLDALQWQRGFVVQLRLARRTLDAIHARRASFRHRALQFVRYLVIVNDDHLWEVLGDWPARARVPYLKFGNEQRRIAHGATAEIPRALPGVVDLELVVAGVAPDLAPLHALALERLQLSKVKPSTLARALCAGPPVKHVELDVLTEDLCTSEALAAVRHLTICPVPARTVLEMLVATGRIATIEALTLSFDRVDASFRAWLAEHRNALAHVRFHWLADSPELGRIVCDTLQRPADAVAMFEERSTSFSLGPYHTIALARCGRKEAALERFEQAMEQLAVNDHSDELLEACEELLIEGPAPALLLHRARLQLYCGLRVTGLDELAPSDPVRLLRGLAGHTTQLEELAEHTTSVTYRALALSALGRFAEVVPWERIDPDAILQAIARNGTATESDRLHCATVAIVEAARVNREVAHARAEALASELRGPTARHHDLLVTIDRRIAHDEGHSWWLRRVHADVCLPNGHNLEMLFAR